MPDGVDFLPFGVPADVLTKRIPWFTEVVPTGPDDPPGEEFEGEDLPDE